MGISQVIEANRDLARDVYERGVDVKVLQDPTGPEICLYCRDDVETTGQGYCGQGIIAILCGTRIVGLVLQQNQTFYSQPVLAEIWRQYETASKEEKDEPAIRLFHAAFCVAFPELADTALSLYPEE